MRPALTMALAATLLGSAVLALWADPPAADEGAAATVAAVAAVRQPAAAVPAVDAVAPSPAPAVDTGTAGTSPTTQLPTRAADWPAPSPAGLAAWQTQATLAANRRATLAVAAAPASAAPRPAAQFPYRWIGQLDDGDGAPQQLLASEQRSVGVRLGATLDGRWRLLRNDAGRLLAQALPDGEALPVPGAPAALP